MAKEKNVTLDDVAELKQKLLEAEKQIEALKVKEAQAPKPTGTRMIISLEEYKGDGKFPPGGSDGKGNLIKFVAKEADIKALEAQGWKVA